MAAPHATILNFGQTNGAGAYDAHFLKLFGGEVWAAYQQDVVTDSRHYQRNITNGKSVQFPMTGTVTVGYHTAGTQLVGQSSNNAEKVIVIDDLLVGDVFFDKLSEAKSHYEVRSIYSSELGSALANNKDENVLRCMVIAARSSNPVTGQDGGTELTSATTLYKTSATDLAAGIFAAKQSLVEKKVKEEANAFMLPAQYYLLAQNVNLINKDWGGAGSYSDGSIIRIAGCPLVMTNNLPTADDSANTGLPSKYRADFTKTAAVVATRMAAATVQLLGITFEQEYQVNRQGTLLVASMAVGHDWGRPQCAVELKTTS